MANSPYVKVVGGRPVLQVTALASAAFGAIAWVWYEGIIEFIDTVWGGILSAPGRFGTWLGEALLPNLLGIVSNGMAAAWETNAEWVAANFGMFALPVVIIEIAVFTWILGFGLVVLFRLITGRGPL